MKTSSKILVAVDFTEPPDDIIAHVLTLYADTDTEIILLHVIPEVQSPSYYLDSFHPAIDLRQIAASEANRSLKRYLDALSGTFAHVVPMVKEGIAFEKIVQTANEQNVEYIVVGDHCREGIGHFLHANVAEHVVRNAKRNVLSFYVPDTTWG